MKCGSCRNLCWTLQIVDITYSVCSRSLKLGLDMARHSVISHVKAWPRAAVEPKVKLWFLSSFRYQPDCLGPTSNSTPWGFCWQETHNTTRCSLTGDWVIPIYRWHEKSQERRMKNGWDDVDPQARLGQLQRPAGSLSGRARLLWIVRSVQFAQYVVWVARSVQRQIVTHTSPGRLLKTILYLSQN